MLASTGEGVPGAPASLLASATVGPGLSRPLVYPGCVGRLSYSRCAEFLMHGEATAGLFCLPYVYMTKSQTLACEDLWQYCMPGKLSASVALLRCIHTAVEGAVVSQPTPDFAVCAMDNDGIDFTNLFTKKQKLASNVNQTQRAATVVGRKRHRADDEAKINSHNEKKSKRAQGAGQREPRREGATAVPGRNLAKRAPPEERREINSKSASNKCAASRGVSLVPSRQRRATRLLRPCRLPQPPAMRATAPNSTSLQVLHLTQRHAHTVTAPPLSPA